MPVPHLDRRWAVLASLLILATATGCSGKASPKLGQSTCGPGNSSSTLTVEPATATPGSKVKVTSTSGCVDEARSRKRLPIHWVRPR